jgi:hypothetical protein
MHIVTETEHAQLMVMCHNDPNSRTNRPTSADYENFQTKYTKLFGKRIVSIYYSRDGWKQADPFGHSDPV